jgi:hypothetical protein
LGQFARGLSPEADAMLRQLKQAHEALTAASSEGTDLRQRVDLLMDDGSGVPKIVREPQVKLDLVLKQHDVRND